MNIPCGTTRRKILKSTILGAATITLLPKPAPGSEQTIHLKAMPTTTSLVGNEGPKTSVLAYNGHVPGPLIRAKQGERLNIEFENALEEPTTIHWHGLRIPLSMDGVPFFSQKPVRPGETFRYSFDLLDAGTFWYHPHIESSEQIGRGLRGVLIVDEAEPVPVDRDVLWVLDDWRLDKDAQIVPFGNFHDKSHAGRIGNVVTVNGSINESYKVQNGERIRLRLANVANARTFALRFDEAKPWLIALDGHPIQPKFLQDNRIILGAGQRADLIIDMKGAPETSDQVIDDAYGNQNAYRLIRFDYTGKTPIQKTKKPPTKLADNPVAPPDLKNAHHHEIIFEGGAMGGMRGAHMDGQFVDMRQLAKAGRLWAMNGTVPSSLPEMKPLLKLKKNKTHIIKLENRTSFPHPIHLHGHSFHILSENGKKPEIRDTTLLMPNERQEIAFVADNPGIWMIHCHILEHQGSGMMAIFEVS